MSFGGGMQGSIRYALIVDDAQATTKLNTFKAGLNSLTAPTANINKNLAQMGTTLKTTSQSVSQNTTVLNQQAAAQKNLQASTMTTGKNVATMGSQFQATANQIKSAGPPLANFEKTSGSLTSKIKSNASSFGGLATGMSATASGALQLAAGFRDYSDAQIAVDRVTRKNSLAQEALGKAQAKLQTLEKSGKATSAELAAARLDVSQADSMAKIQVQLLGEAQERMFDSQSQFIASVIPTSLGAIGTLSQAFGTLGGNMGKLKSIVPAVTGAMSSIAGAFTTTGAAATTATVGVNGLKTALMGFGGPMAILIAGAVGVYEGTKTMYDAIRILDQGITSHAGNVSALEMLYGRMRIALGQASEEEKKAFYQMEADQDKIVKGLEKVKIPPWERIFGLSPDTQKRLADAAALINGELTPAVETNAKAVTNAGKATAENTKLTTADVVKQIVHRNVVREGKENYEKYFTTLQEGSSKVDKYGRTWKVVNGIEVDITDQIIKNQKAIEARSEALRYQGVIQEMVKRTQKEGTRQLFDEAAALKNVGKTLKDADGNLLTFNVTLGKWVAIVPKATEATIEQNKHLLEQAEQLGATEKELAKYTVTEETTAEEAARLNAELEKGTMALAKNLKFLTDTDRDLGLVKDGFKQGAVEFKTWHDNLIKGIESGRTFGDRVRYWAEQLGIGADVIKNKTIPELQAMIPVLLGDKDAFAELQKKMAEGFPELKAAFEIEEGIDDAMKGFVEDLPKEMRKKFKLTLDIEQSEKDFSKGLDNLVNGAIELIEGQGYQFKPGLEIDTVDEAKDWADTVIDNLNSEFPKKKGKAQIPADVLEWEEGLEEAAKKGPEAVITYLETTGKLQMVQAAGKIPPALEAKFNELGIKLPEADISAFDVSLINSAEAAVFFRDQVNTLALKLPEIDIEDTTGSIDHIIDNFNGYIKVVEQSEPSARIDITKATKLITRLIGNFNGWVKAVNKANPVVKLNADAAFKTINRLVGNLNGIPNITRTVTIKKNYVTAQGGFHTNRLEEDTIIQAHRGERVDIGPGHVNSAGGGGGFGGNGTLVVNLVNVLSDKEITRTFRKELGKDIYRFGPT